MKDSEKAVYFEYIALGDTMKVSAIDGASGVETAVVGPATAARHDLERLALAKLNKKLERRTEKSRKTKKRPGWLA
ncbi:MAG: serine hydroxymethyltransferase [Pseudomonadota bacterium]